MLFYLLSPSELGALLHRLGYDWSPDRVRETIDYYLARTTDGSALSAVVHAWVLARAHREQAFDEFVDALLSDVADVQGGTLELAILYRGHDVTLAIEDHDVLVSSGSGRLAPVRVGCHGQVRELGNGQTLQFKL